MRSWGARMVWGLGLVVMGSLAQGGCATGRYLLRASTGHLDLVTAAVPIEQVLERPDLPAGIRTVLQEMEPLRAWAGRTGLVLDGSYERFVPLDRRAAVWNVNASKPLALEQHTWTFPIVGSVPYLGFFDPFEAWAHARELAEEQGLDVYVRPVSAYSTLGWMADPLLSTMIDPGPGAIGGTINRVLHEATHSTIYVNGQSTFNENVATFIGDGLTIAYLTERFGASSPELLAFVQMQEAWAREREILLAVHSELEELYGSDVPDEEKLARKAEIFARLGRELNAPRPLNNATLVYLQTYRSGGPELDALHAACGGDWSRTIRALGTLVETHFTREQQDDLGPVIERLTQRGC